MTYKFEECRKFVEWDFNGKDDKYTIRIRRHEKYSSELSKSYMRSDEGPHGWCLYIYIYPSHPLFDKIVDESDYYVRPISDMPLHGGCTYMKWHRNPAGKITSKEIGCDYQHYCDEYYSRCDCPTQSSIWNDAVELAEFMDIIMEKTTMKNEVNELLEAWDSGKTITTLSMGGLGPGYEQAIQIMAVEFARELRHLNIEDYPEKEVLNNVVRETCNKVLKRIDEDIGGATGAMYGAAQWLAYQWCFGHGVKGVLEKAKEMGEEERVIVVSKNTPKCTETTK